MTVTQYYSLAVINFQRNIRETYLKSIDYGTIL